MRRSRRLGHRAAADRAVGPSVRQAPAGLNASHLSDYPVDEVLDHVDADARAFLLRCSVLRSMNDALIVRLTGEDNGQQRLEELERQGLFIHRMDDTGEWFNFHPLFASFLRQRCQWELALELPGLHRAAAEGWLALGYPAEAIHHALAASDVSMLRDILLQHAGRCSTTANWPCWRSAQRAAV